MRAMRAHSGRGPDSARAAGARARRDTKASGEYAQVLSSANIHLSYLMPDQLRHRIIRSIPRTDL